MLLLVIVLLHGGEVHLNPNEIVALIVSREAHDPHKQYADDVRCVVAMTDGKLYTTREECTSVEARLGKLRGP